MAIGSRITLVTFLALCRYTGIHRAYPPVAILTDDRAVPGLAVRTILPGYTFIPFVSFRSPCRYTKVLWLSVHHDPPVTIGSDVRGTSVITVIPRQEFIEVLLRGPGPVPLGSGILGVLHSGGHIFDPEFISRLAVLSIGTVLAVHPVLPFQILEEISDGSTS